MEQITVTRLLIRRTTGDTRARLEFPLKMHDVTVRVRMTCLSVFLMKVRVTKDKET